MDFLALLKAEKARANGSDKSKIQELSTKIDEKVIPMESNLSKPWKVVPISVPFDRREEFQIGAIPTVFYFPDVISERDEQDILHNISMSSNWKKLRTRRVQCWSKLPSVGLYGTSDHQPCGFPIWLESLSSNLTDMGIFDSTCKPNHVLINEYQSDEGIMHHTDGPAYHPCVCVLSLGSSRVMTFKKRLSPNEIGSDNDKELFSICLKPRSLLVFQDLAYSDYMHGINADPNDDIIQDENCSVPCINCDLSCSKPGDIIRKTLRTSLTIRTMIDSTISNS